MKPPKNLLQDSFEYYAYLGNDNEWQKDEYADAITIDTCHIDRSVAYSSSNGENTQFGYVIYCYHGVTEPMPRFKAKSLIKVDGKEMRLVNIIENRYGGNLYGYELEVI